MLANTENPGGVTLVLLISLAASQDGRPKNESQHLCGKHHDSKHILNGESPARQPQKSTTYMVVFSVFIGLVKRNEMTLDIHGMPSLVFSRITLGPGIVPKAYET